MNGSQESVDASIRNSTVDNEDDSEYEDFFSSLSLLFTFVMLIMCMAGTLMNAISLMIFTRPAFRKRSINILLVGLSASDLCLCILAVPVFSLSQIQQLIPSLSPVRTGQLLLYAYPVTLMAQTMSVWMLVAITIDRYLAVCHPFAVRIHCTTRRAVVTVLLVLVFSVAYNLIRFWEYTVNDDPLLEDELQIVGLLRENQLYMILYQTICNLVTQFVVPLFVLCVLSLQVARTIISVTEQRKELVKSEQREHSAAKMMIFVVIVFVFCYSLSFCLNVLELCHPNLFKQHVGYLLNDVNNILIVFNSSTSFIFYTKYSSRYRTQLKKFFTMVYLYRQIRRSLMVKPHKQTYRTVICEERGDLSPCTTTDRLERHSPRSSIFRTNGVALMRDECQLQLTNHLRV